MNTATTEAPVTIGAELNGGIYAGLTIHNETPSRLVLLPDEFTGTWKQAIAWAKKLDAELPTRMDQLAMWNNIRGEFQKDWYWSSEQDESNADSAWSQGFDDGTQYGDHEDLKLRARAVRRFAI
jgi:hypothetical protein